MFRKFSGLFAILFFAAVHVSAARLPVKIYTSADGLGSSYINSISPDSRGFLWFLTRDGLSRYDGQEFTTYKIAASEESASPGIELIYEERGEDDGGSVYWITTTGGTYRFDARKREESSAVKEAEKNVLNAEFVTPLRGPVYKDSQKNLWLGGDGLFSAKQGTDGKFMLEKTEMNYPDRAWEKYPVIQIYETPDRSLWLTTKCGLIRRLANGKTIFYTFDESSAGKINITLADADGRIWVVSDNFVDVFSPEPADGLSGDEKIITRDFTAQAKQSGANGKVVLPTGANQITRIADVRNREDKFYQIYQSRDRHLWITAGKLLLEYNGENLTSYGEAEGFTARVNSIAEDAGGNIWFGGTNGASRLGRSGMTAFAAPVDGLGSNVIYSFYNRGGSFYVVNGNTFVSRLNGAKFETVQLETDKNASFAWFSNVAYPDSRGEWWVATTDKLYRFAALQSFFDVKSEIPKAVYTKAEGLKGNFIFRIFEDSKSNLWISTHDRDTESVGLTLWTRADEKFHAFTEADGYPKYKSPASFVEAPDGTLWFGFYEEGLIRYRDGVFSEVKEKLPKGFFTAIYFDSQNRLWLASSQSGITRFDDPNNLAQISAKYTTDNDLSSNNVRSLVTDGDGAIYVGTARGVDRIAPETGIIRHFSANDGLSGDFVNAAAQDGSGALWFGTSNGLSRYMPQAEKAKPVPAVWISGLRVAGENRYVPPLGTNEISNLELAANQNNLQVDFFAVNFESGEDLRYQYKLEGADADWSEPTAQRTVNYANLAAGNYRFLLRAAVPNNAAGENFSLNPPARISLSVLAPVYRRSWFILSMLFLLGFGLFILDRYRVKKTRQVKAALDISRKSEQAARASEMRYRTLAETASDAIITIDDASRIVYANEATEKVFGYQSAELIGKSLTDLMPEDLREGHEQGFKRYLTTNYKHLAWSAIELFGHHKSGAVIPLELSFGEFEADGKRYFTGVARDVSERKRAEAALEKSRADRLAELERVRARIARDLHDDVGSSLTQIALFSEVAKQNINDKNDTVAREPLDFLVQTSNDLVEAMSDIVWAINPDKDHFHDLTQRMRRFASETLTAADIDLEFVVPQTEPDAPFGANLRREIFLIFKESINNIVKHSGASAVEINFSAENGYLRLIISDNGRGFEARNEKAGDYDWRAAGGGNGLPGMKRRALDLHGDFSIESKAGAGTMVILSVPLDIELETTISPE